MKVRTNYKILFSLALLVLMALLFSYNFSKASTKDATKFINYVSKTVVEIIERDDITVEKKEDKLEKMFLKFVDTNWIGKFALGRYWRTSNDKQQKKFLQIFPEYLTALYVPYFRNYVAHSVKIKNVVQTSNDEYLVQTELINAENMQFIKVNYRLVKKGPYYKDFVIFDIIAEGVSLISTKRAEFNSVIKEHGIDFLIKKINNK